MYWHKLSSFFVHKEDTGQDLVQLINEGKFITSIHMQINSLSFLASQVSVGIKKKEEKGPTKNKNADTTLIALAKLAVYTTVLLSLSSNILLV